MITNKQNKIIYQGNNLATEFAYTFPITDSEDLKVILVNADGNQVVLKKDYFVDAIKKVVVYPGYAPGQELDESSRPPVLTDGEKLILYRELDPLQIEDFGKVYPLNILEKALDKLTILVQQVLEKISRSVVIPLGGNFKGDLPAPVKTNSAICINNNGTGLRYAGDPDVAIANSKNAVARITELERRYENAKISDADSLNGKTYDQLVAEAQAITDAQTLQGKSLDEVQNATKLDGSTKEDIIIAASQPVGTIYYALRTDTPEGSVRLDGTEYTQELFPDFYAQLVSGKFPKITYAEYATQLADNNGNCGVFGIDTLNNKFKVPAIADGTFIASGIAGQYFEAGLPNIDGKITVMQEGGASSPNGAFYSNRTNYAIASASQANIPVVEGFDASLSNPIYGNSNTVTPIHIRYPLFMVLANKAQTASEAQYGEFIGALEGKVNNDFSNVTSIAKATAVRWAIPDYNRKMQIAINDGASFTVPSDGVLTIVMAWNGHNTWYSIKRGLGATSNVSYNQLGGGGGSGGGAVSADYIIEKGEIIKYYSASGSNNFIYFCPFKGAE